MKNNLGVKGLLIIYELKSEKLSVYIIVITRLLHSSVTLITGTKKNADDYVM